MLEEALCHKGQAVFKEEPLLFEHTAQQSVRIYEIDRRRGHWIEVCLGASEVVRLVIADYGCVCLKPYVSERQADHPVDI